ncbi:J domain-containing protein [Niallia oryzisoli]|uniref:J domain-containing protein n=1 Tax=Niallia oryzisoli TaxID=1737571 RepID=UPI003735996C
MDSFVNYYDILGVKSSATMEEIKKAYRKRSKETHPDRKGGSSALFILVQEAYEVLSDEHKRVEYDLYLEEYIKTHSLMKTAAYSDRKFTGPLPKMKNKSLRRNIIATLCSIVLLIVIAFGVLKYQSDIQEIKELKKQISTIQKENESVAEIDTSSDEQAPDIYSVKQPIKESASETVYYKANADPSFIAFYEDIKPVYDTLIEEFNKVENRDFKETQVLLNTAEELRVLVSNHILNGQYEYARFGMVEGLEKLISDISVNSPPYELLNDMGDIQLNYRDILSVTLEQ